jgi:hypothetical protein
LLGEQLAEAVSLIMLMVIVAPFKPRGSLDNVQFHGQMLKRTVEKSSRRWCFINSQNLFILPSWLSRQGTVTQNMSKIGTILDGAQRQPLYALRAAIPND